MSSYLIDQDETKILETVEAISTILGADGSVSMRKVIQVETNHPKLARIIDDLVDGEKLVRLPGAAAIAEPELVPAAEKPGVRILAIPIVPPDPEPSLKPAEVSAPAAAVSAETAGHVCLVCGDPIPARSKYCRKPDCQHEKQRRYNAAHNARKKAETSTVPDPEPDAAESKVDEPGEPEPPFDAKTLIWPPATNWYCKMGSIAGRFLSSWELGDAIRDGKLQEGDLLIHKTRGEHVATLKKDRLMFVPLPKSAGTIASAETPEAE